MMNLPDLTGRKSTDNWTKILLVLMFSLFTALLAGCDDKDTAPSAPSSAPSAPSSAQPAQSSQTKQAASSQAATTASAHQQSPQETNQPFKLLDGSEIQLDGAGTMALTFSLPLNPQQDFNQLIQLRDQQSGTLQGGWELSANQKVLWFRNLPPKRKLDVSVAASLQAANKQMLGERWSATIETNDIQPAVGFASRGSLLPERVISGLPVIALNVNTVQVNFFRIKEDELPDFIRQWQYENNLSIWEWQDSLLRKADLIYTGQFALNPKKNVREKLLLPVNNIKPLQQPGVYFAIMNEAGNYQYRNPATLFTISDIGISLHNYPQRSDFFIQSLADGTPKSGVALKFLDKKGQILADQLLTDHDGHATLEKNLPDAVLVLASDGQQITLLDLKRPALDLSEFQLTGDKAYQKQFFMFGPRDLYRPGETILLNALLRDADGKPLPAQPVKLQVIQPDGTLVHSQSWQAENGLYQFSWSLHRDAPTGLWQFLVDSGDGEQQQWNVHVEDFQPERMALELQADMPPNSTTFTDFNGFRVNGRYLYGAPAANNQLQGQLYVRPLRDAVSTLPGFEFGNIDASNLFRTLDEVDIRLDEQGNGLIPVADWQQDNNAPISSPVRVILQASLLETGGRTITRRAQQAIWPTAVLPGIRPAFDKKTVYNYATDKQESQPMVRENSNASFDIVYANAQGERKAVQGLHVSLIYERRDIFWYWHSSWSERITHKDIPVSEQTLNLAAGQTAHISVPVEWGTYRLEVTDPHGNMSSIRFWAGYSWQDNSDGNSAPRPDQVTLKIDQPFYRGGDTAKVHLTAPIAGKGYLLVESSQGALWWQTVDVPENGLDIEVPIDKSWQRHDLYLHALVVRQPDASRSATVKRAVGVLYLPIGDTSRHLNLALNTPEKMRPNQPLTVKIKATSANGAVPEKINVLISVVDSGVLNITNYHTPDPWQAFMGRKKYQVDIYDIYHQVIEGQGRNAMLRFGGDGDDPLASGGKKPPDHVHILAQQAQPVQLDANGEGVVTLPIGDFNGEVRVMAQAWSADRFASAQRQMTIAAPVVVELNTPRFLANGDNAQLALDINNLTDQPQTLTITPQGSGLLSVASDAQQLALPAHTRRTLPLSVTAQAGFGDAVLTIRVDGLADDESSDAESSEDSLTNDSLPDDKTAPAKATSLTKQWRIGVRPAFPAQTVRFTHSLAPGQQWQLANNALKGLMPDTINGRLVLSGQPSINIGHYVAALKAYPYGCLEQTTSGLYPSLYSNSKQLAKMGISGSSEQKNREAINLGIPHLLSMQLANGGFAMWDNQGREQYWLTVYATDFLLRAKQRGYNVPDTALNKAINRLTRYLQDRNVIDVQYSSNNKASQFAVQAYSALVLAGQQKAPLGALRSLWQRHDEAKNGLPLVQLGIALKLMGDDPRGDQAIDLGLQTHRDQWYGDWLGDYGSELRDQALILAAMVENHLFNNNPSWQAQQSSMINHISLAASEQNWLSTQQNNALYLAGRAMLNNSAPWQATSSLSDTPLQSDKSQTHSLSAEQLPTLTITNQGKDELWLQLDSQGYPNNPPAAYSNVLHISRHIYSVQTAESISTAQLHSGDLLVVWLQVTADNRVPDALIVDLLPGGLELENQNLADSSASLKNAMEQMSNDYLSDKLRDMQQLNINHLEYRDDRFVAALSINKKQTVNLFYLARAVTPGIYQIPSPLVESMYSPQWRALGDPEGKLTIRPAN